MKTALSGGRGLVGCVHLKGVVNFIRLWFEFGGEELFNVKGVARVGIGQVFVVGMLCDVVLVREERTNASELKNALAAVHDGKLVLAHQLLAELLVIEAMRCFPAPALAGIEGVDGFLAQRRRQLLQCRRLLAAEKN